MLSTEACQWDWNDAATVLYTFGEVLPEVEMLPKVTHQPKGVKEGQRLSEIEIHVEPQYLRARTESRSRIIQIGRHQLLLNHVRSSDKPYPGFDTMLAESESRGFWNRSHELVHRLAEPPQKILPFRRHRFEATNPVEKLVDSIAGELAFYPPLFRPLVNKAVKKKQPLSLKTVIQIQNQFAPTSSLLAATNAVVNHWPTPRGDF